MFFNGLFYYASINVKPEGGGGTPGIVGHLTSIAFPTLGNLTKNLGPRVGTFAFFAWKNETKSRRPTCPDFRFVIRFVNGQCPYR